MFIAQLIKVLIEAARGQFSWENLNNYGGMPSSHAALVTSLVFVLVYQKGGFDAGAVAVAVILLIIVLRDAVGFRRQLGVHAKMINKLIKDLPRAKEYKYPVLHERLGHTPTEVLAGVVVGVILSYLAILLIV